MAEVIKAFIVENDPDAAETAEEILKRAGVAVVGVATTYEDALKAVRENGRLNRSNTDVLLLDLSLIDDHDPNDRSGVIIAEEIKKNPGLAGVIIISISSREFPYPVDGKIGKGGLSDLPNLVRNVLQYRQ